MRTFGIVHTIHERFVKQLDGSRYQGTNCTMGAGCSLAYRHTHGKRSYKASYFRFLTGDTSGGTNLDQLRNVFVRLGIATGLSPAYRGLAMHSFYAYLRGNRGAAVQGSSRATYGTRWRASFTFRGNHAWYIARGRGWAIVNGVWKPDDVLVYDPLADGRAAGIAKSPFWLPRAYFEKFCAYLSFGGETLGFGKVYALFSKDTIPHRHATYGGVAIPRTKFKLKGGHRIRNKPGGSTLATTSAGDVFDAWQKLSTGPLLVGSRVWYGDHSGTRWIHSSVRAA